MLTKQHYKTTAETLKHLLQEFSEPETETYTVDFVVEKLIGYMEYCVINEFENSSDSPSEAYERAMQVIG